jgi:hypothetical protein
MASVSRRSTVALAICCGVLLASQALLVSVPMSAAAGSSCTELRRWAQSYRGTSPTLEQLARYDRAHRVAIFNAVTPEVRAALWQEQLRRFDQRPDLSMSQHNLIAEARNLVTPALYTHDPAATTAFETLTPRIKQAFTVKEHKQMWTTVGFTGLVAAQPQTATLLDKLTGPFVVHAQTDFCECNTSSGAFECWSGVCISNGCNWQNGCGIGGGSTCNGMCM